MIWLWGIPPVLIVAGAIWLAIGTRSLVQSRMDVADDLQTALREAKVASEHLRAAIDAAQAHGASEAGVDPPGR